MLKNRNNKLPRNSHIGKAAYNQTLTDTSQEGQLGHTLTTLLSGQYAVISQSRRNAVKDDDPEHIHDLRVAVRRFRTILRFFRKELKPGSAAVLDKKLKLLNREAGTARDFDVWNAFLEKTAKAKGIKRSSAWYRYCKKHKETGAKLRKDAKSLVSTAKFRPLKKAIDAFLTQGLQDSLRKGASKAYFSTIIGKWILAMPLRMQKLMAPGHDNSPELLHDIRRSIRRERYMVEFATPFFGPAVNALAVRIKSVTSALGDIHDMDVFYQHMLTAEDNPPPGLADTIVRQRRQCLREFYLAWDKLVPSKKVQELKKEITNKGQGIKQ